MKSDTGWHPAAAFGRKISDCFFTRKGAPAFILSLPGDFWEKISFKADTR
jgi:hypothetical protein